MGLSSDYADPDWQYKDTGYHTGERVKYKGNVWLAAFWGSEPGVGDPAENGWRLYDELYDQTPHTPTAQAKVIAYVPTWRKKEGFNYANPELYQYITHAVLAFLSFSEANRGEFDPASVDEVQAVLPDVVSTAHGCGTLVLVALGGANDYGFLALMNAVGNNAAHPLLGQAVQNVARFVQANGLDGVDLDLECWWGKPGEKDQGGRSKKDGPHPAAQALAHFAQQLKSAVPDKLVSATLFGTSWYGNNYDPALADHVDWLAIMTYDLTGSWNGSPVGPHSALYKIRNQTQYADEQQGEWPDPNNQHKGTENNPILSVEDTLWYWTNPFFVNWQGPGQKLPRNKVAAGVPLYGYDFAYAKGPDDQSGLVPPGYKTLTYKEILEKFPDAHAAPNGNIRVPGQTPRPPFVAAPGAYPHANNIYFETPEMAVAKLNFLKSVGAQGVIVWEISGDVWDDQKSILKALYRQSGNPGQRPALAGSKVLGHRGPILGHRGPPSSWEEVRGANAYRYCTCSNAGNFQSGAVHAHTMAVEPGTPFFYAVLTKDDISGDFPTGTVLTVEGPDGTKYDHDVEQEDLWVLTSGPSVRYLIVQNPKPGNWVMTIQATGETAFWCECNTVPSQDPYDTVQNALQNRLTRRDVVTAPEAEVAGAVVTAFLGIALIIASPALATPALALGVLSATFLIAALGGSYLTFGRGGLGSAITPTQRARTGQVYRNAAKGRGGISKGPRNNQSAANLTAIARSVSKNKRQPEFVYAVVHDGGGQFFIFTKHELAYFFSSNGGTVLPQGSVPHGAGDYALPGGGLMDGEDCLVGALREFLEETNVALSDAQWAPDWAFWPSPYEGLEPPNTKYCGVYFEFLDQQAFQNLFRRVTRNLDSGAQAAQAVQARQYGQGQYNDLVNRFTEAPLDNELATVQISNLLDAGTWNTIQGWNDRNKSWFYQILNKLRTETQDVLVFNV